MKKLFFILTILLCNLFALHSEKITFTVKAPEAVVQGDQYRVVYTLNSHQGTSLRSPEFTGSTLLFGPATSSMSSYSNINGQMSSVLSTTYTYTLQADKQGSHTIGSATIEVEGKTYTAQGFTMKVLPPDKNSGASGSNSTANGSSRNNMTTSNEKTFVRLILSRSSVYEQQPLKATIKLYTQAAGVSMSSIKAPTFEGFVAQEIELPKDRSFVLENYDGVNYRTVALAEYQLFPQRSGEVTITSGTYDVVVQVMRQIDTRSFFGPMSTTQEIQKSLTTPERTLHVKPLPAGKPATFSGGVGEFTLQAELSSDKVKANEAITLKLEIAGTGNLKYLKNPEVEFPLDFEVYDPQVDLQTTTTATGVRGKRLIEYTVVPRFGGTFTIPAITFSYFDLKSESYKTLTTTPYTIEVEKGANSEATSQEGGGVTRFNNKEEISLLNTDIRFIKQEGEELQKELHFIYGEGIYWYIYLTAILLFGAVILINRKQAQANANVAANKTRKANKVATKRLKQAQTYLKLHDKEHFYDEVLKALWGYLSDKLSMPISALTKDNVEQELRTYGASDQVIAQFMELLNSCEFARYAPGSNDEAMDNLYQQTLTAIGEMENQVKITSRK